MIWSHPKTTIILLAIVINIKDSFRYRINFINNYFKWIPFIISMWTSTIFANDPTTSLTGGQIGNGLIFWLGLSILYTQLETINNYKKNKLGNIKKGFIIGGIITIILAIPQLFYPEIDYTIISLIDPSSDKNITSGGIYQNQQPISIFSHKAHFSAICLALYSIAEGKVKLIFIAGIITTTTRTTLVILAKDLLTKINFKKTICIVIVIILIIQIGKTKPTDNKTIIFRPWNIKQSLYKYNNYTSGRIWYIDTGIKNIRKLNKKEIIIGSGTPGAYQLIIKNYNAEPISTSQYHNFILDTIFSTGIIGLITYIFLLYKIKNSSTNILLNYTIFTFFWFDCSQFTHIFFIGNLMSISETKRNKGRVKSIFKSKQKQLSKIEKS